MTPRFLAVIAMLMLALPAAAQDLAGKTVTIVVPFTPGAVSDPLARVIAPRLGGEILGANVIVENKAGGNTNIGSLYVAKAPPDGRTLLFAGTGITMNVAIYKDKMPFDPLRISRRSRWCQRPIRAGGQSEPGRRKPERADRASEEQTRRSQLRLRRSRQHDAAHHGVFKLKSGTDIVHVPYRGAGRP